jgi:hypothetical protein
MSQELGNDLTSWWNGQSFDGRESFKMDDAGTLILCANNNIKERAIAALSPENADITLANLKEKFASVEAKVREVEAEWISADDKLKMADKVAHLKDLLDHVHAAGNFEKAASLVHSWEQALHALAEENYTAKLKMAELAESLAQSGQWKDATQAFRDISDKWKQSGHVDKGRNDKLWNRVEAARKIFHDRKRSHQEEEEKDLLHNLDLKIDLVEQAEAIANSTEWKKTTEIFHRLTEEWKTIGHTLNKKNEELWQRFLAAKSAFFEKKRGHSQMVQQEQEASYAIKVAIAEKAEALKESTDWTATTQAHAALNEEWKKTGRVPQEKADELRKRFSDAQEYFFDAKRKHTGQIKTEQENNYNQKKIIVARAEQLKSSTRWGEVTAELGELMIQWKKIGPVPRSYGDKLWEEFSAARKHFFARKDESREQRRQYVEEQKVARVEQAKSIIHKLKHDLQEEEEKLADFRNSIENITPGKKAAELRQHLENLITETARTIKRLKEKYDAATADINSVEPKPEPAAAAHNQGE